MGQLDLFTVSRTNYGVRIEPARLAATTDPSTSLAAAEEVTRNGQADVQRQMVLEVLRRHPGMTSAEMARMSGTPGSRHLFARRLPDLVKLRLARQGEKRECVVCKSVCVTWWPEEEQRS